ncbi:endoribonuclease YbeY [Ascaphus truei]|uniref:endoribonuclease YbeY n=1 Tax=Ascaphus truei TaxID=8439 RepID=UPI003F5ACF26
MSLILRNVQRVVPLHRATLRRGLEAARSCLRVSNFDVGVICTDNSRIQRINRAYRGEDRATDVLSFPFHEGLVPGSCRSPPVRMNTTWVICTLGVEFIYQQCQETQEDYSSILTRTLDAAPGVTDLCRLRLRPRWR